MATLNKAGRNEQRKITATVINNLAVSLVVTGLVVPSVNMTYQMTFPRTTDWAAFALLWALASAVVHCLARLLLKGLEK